jgi:hypothetical protein
VDTEKKEAEQVDEGRPGLSVDEAAARMAGSEAPAVVPGEGEVPAVVPDEGEAPGEGEVPAVVPGEVPGEGEDKNEGKLSEKAQQILEREIGKKVAKWHEREEQLLTRIEELERTAAGSRPAGALEVLSLSADQLDAEEERIQRVLDFCELHPDGYEADPGDKDDRTLTAEQVRQAKVENGRRLREIPRARQVLEAKAASERDAVEVYPEMRRGGADRGMYEAFCRRHPSFRGEPHGLMIVGDMLAMEKMRKERAEAAKRGAGGRPPAARTLPGQAGGKKPSVAAGSKGAEGYTMARMIADGGTVEAATRLMMERGKRAG